MKSKQNFIIYFVFVSASILFLYLEQFTHIEFFLHLAAIPLEVLLAVFIVERLLERRESKNKRKDLMFIKSYLFRSELKSLFISNFEALKFPAVDFTAIKNASIEELFQIRKDAESIEYLSDEAVEKVINEYAEKEDVWRQFIDWAIKFNFEEILEDMIYILHFIQDVKLYKEHNPDKSFISAAKNSQVLIKKVNKVLHDGIQKFLDYAIELKKTQTGIFQEIMEDYEICRKIKYSGKSIQQQKH